MDKTDTEKKMAHKRKNSNLSVVLKRHRVAVFAVLLATALNLFFLLWFPRMIKNYAEKKLSYQISREVTIGGFRFNPYNLTAEIRNVFIQEPDSSEVFFYSKNIFVNISIFSFFRRTPVIRQLEIKEPYLKIVRGKEYSYNFSDLINKDSTGEKPLRFFIGNIEIERGRIVFYDMPKEQKHFVRRMDLSLPFISNFPAFVQIHTKPHFAAEINGTPVDISGKTRPFDDSFETFFDIETGIISLTDYVAYMPASLNFELYSADIEANIRLSYLQKYNETPSLEIKGDLALTELDIRSKDKNPLVKIKGVYCSIDFFELLSRQAAIKNLKILSPEITISKTQDEGINIVESFRVNRSQKKNVNSVEEKNPSFLFDVENIDLSGGRVFFHDKTPQSPFESKMDSIELSITGLSNRENSFAEISFSAESPKEETFNLTGKTGLNPFFSEGKIDIGQLSINKYFPYYENHILFSLPEGKSDITGRYRYFAEKGEFSFGDVEISLINIKAEKDGITFLDIPSLYVTGGEIDITGKQIIIEDCHGENISFKATRKENGKLDFMPLFPEKTHENGLHVEETPSENWFFTAGRFKISDSSILITDTLPEGCANIFAENIEFQISNISPGTSEKSPLTTSFHLNKGSVSAEGHMANNPFSAEISLQAEGIPIASLQPYISEKIDITVTDGNANTEGSFTVKNSENGRHSLSYKGTASIDNFKSIHREHGDTFINWKKFSLKDSEIGINPDVFSVEEISLENLLVNAVVYPDRELNLLKAIRKSPEKKPLEKENKEEALPKRTKTEINRVSIRNSRLNFLDRSIEPSYSVEFQNFSGSIKGLSSIKREAADIEMHADIYGHSPLRIKGIIHPLGRDLFLDMELTMDGLDLTSVTPYSRKYIGYGIRRGRLILNLEYLIEQRNLRSQNRFVFDQLALGYRVESPDATRLPVRFAIALLRDSSGRININFPVSGSLDDPQFRLGPLIVQMFVNLLTRAAVSPFGLLGSVFGGGPELSFIEFEYGSSLIQKKEQEKLDILVKILKDRPALNLEISGRTDTEEDTRALKNITLMNKLSTYKLREMIGMGKEAVPLNEIEITDQEYENYLRIIYSEEFPTETAEENEETEQISIEEIEKLVKDTIDITANDLRHLATARAREARNYMVLSGISSDRVFLIEPNSIKPEKSDESMKESRADFQLR